MSEPQLKALQRYVSAVAYFMVNHERGDGMIAELLASRTALEAAFGVSLPVTLRNPDFPNIL